MYRTVGMSHVQNMDFLKTKQKKSVAFLLKMAFFWGGPEKKMQGEQPMPVDFFQHTVLSLHKSAAQVNEPTNPSALCL